MPSSHRRHGQDKTRQNFCLVRVGGVITIGDKSNCRRQKISETEHVFAVFLSKFGVNKTSMQTRSHRRQDWTKLFSLQYIDDY